MDWIRSLLVTPRTSRFLLLVKSSVPFALFLLLPSMINYSSSKPCCLNPILTFLLEQLIPVLASPISQIFNLSLSSSHMPTVLKSAKITSLLKKTGLDPDCLSNYRRISNLPPLISKLIERTVATQTVTHFTDNYLFMPVQSAYHSGHSIETALVRVFNDLLQRRQRNREDLK